MRSLLLNLGIKDPRRSKNNLFQLVLVVVVHVLNNSKPVPQRRRQHSGPGRCSNQGKGRQGEVNRVGGWPFPDHNVDVVILHCRVEHFLHDLGQAVNFVNEENVSGLEFV